MRKGVLAVLLAVLFAGGAPAAEKIDVLVLRAAASAAIKNMSLDPKLCGELAAENIHLVASALEKPISQEMLKNFNSVVIMDWEGDRIHYFLPNMVSEALTLRRNLEEIKTYVRNGGSLFFSPCPGGSIGAQAQSRFLKEFGAELLPLSIRDGKNAFLTRYPDQLPDEYAWTTNITPHPVTRGVKTVFYPQTQLRWDDMYASAAVRLDRNWQIPVKGMPESSEARCFDYEKWEPNGRTAPPLVAVRDFGKGRIGLLSVSFYYTLFRPYDNPAKGWLGEAHTGKIGGVFLHHGDGKTNSDGFQLLTNLFRYLAEPGRKLGFGNYNPETYAKLKVPPAVPMPEWLKHRSVKRGDRLHKILVGARSSYSDGSGSIAEFAREAEKAGVGVLVMTETFEAFDPARWDAFLNDCRAASSDRILVLPGIDLPDPWGNRFLLFNTPLFPPKPLLTPDGKALARVQYLCLCFPQATTIAHRVSSGNVPHQLLKHFQGISIYTYNRKGELVDNSLPVYEWQVQAISNPFPYAVHEIYAPSEVGAAAAAGHQVYAFAPSLKELQFYLGEHGTAHFWEDPTRLQISSGPLITELAGAPYLRIDSREPLKEVRLYSGRQLLRRWLPKGGSFEIPLVARIPAHIAWGYFHAEDARGNTVISPGLQLGGSEGKVHTWRCGDRQNWWNYPNLYTGTMLFGLRLKTPVFGTREMSGGMNGYPYPEGPLRGENPAPILEFPFAGSAVYIQDASVERYAQALYTDTAFDAKNANPTTMPRISRAAVRYYQFLERRATGNHMILPMLFDVRLRLLRPAEPERRIFPVLTELNTYELPVQGDLSYCYRDPKTGREVSGKLNRNSYVDIPRGGRVGGLIVLSDSLRIGGPGLEVGFAAEPDWTTVYPAGTEWHGAFTIVEPAQADRWRKLLGFDGETPYRFQLNQGRILRRNYLVEAEGPLVGEVTVPLKPADYAGLTGIPDNPDRNGRRPPTPITEFRLPFRVTGLNPNWSAGLYIPGQPLERVDFFENAAWVRLDLTRAGGFAVDSLLRCDAPALRIGVMSWTADAIRVEVHNPTDRPVKTVLRTWPQPKELLQGEFPIEIAAGSSQYLTLKK